MNIVNFFNFLKNWVEVITMFVTCIALFLTKKALVSDAKAAVFDRKMQIYAFVASLEDLKDEGEYRDRTDPKGKLKRLTSIPFFNNGVDLSKIMTMMREIELLWKRKENDENDYVNCAYLLLENYKYLVYELKKDENEQSADLVEKYENEMFKQVRLMFNDQRDANGKIIQHKMMDRLKKSIRL